MGVTSKIMIMKYFLAICLSALLMSFSVYAQGNNYTKHTVLKGETIRDIATKYKVTPFDIYRLNPDSQSGIKESEVLLIPASLVKEVVTPVVNETKSKVIADNQKTHVVKPKETFYSICKAYGITVEDLKKSNADVLKEGLKTGQTLTIPTSKASSNVEVKTPKVVAETSKKIDKKEEVVTKDDKVIYHVVEPKETKFGIAKNMGLQFKS